MGSPRLRTYSIKEDVLLGLAQEGYTHPLVNARLNYAQAQQCLSQYVEKLKSDRIYPHMLPTQASGRWSTTKPPLANFSAQCINPDHELWPEHVKKTKECWSLRNCLIPDIGWMWVSFDWDAIEAKLVSAYTRDKRDLEAYEKGYDIHTVTGVGMYKWPEPDFEPTKKNIWGPAGENWLEKLKALGFEYEDADCRQRRLIKNCRYCLAYAKNVSAMDRYAHEMQMPPKELRKAGEDYLRSKPWLTSWQAKTWAAVGRTRIARTFLGRRRVFMGKQYDIQKEGLNHIIQGGVADSMNDTLIKIQEEFPESYLIVNKHDGATNAFPRTITDFSRLYSIVQREWNVAGVSLKFTASFESTYPPEEAAP